MIFEKTSFLSRLCPMELKKCSIGIIIIKLILDITDMEQKFKDYKAF
jgi:hypothetical protein